MADAIHYLDPIPQIIPFGTLTIFAGAPGVGKTTLLIEWMQRWLSSRSIFNHPTNPPTHFYYVCADRGTTPEEFYAKVGVPREFVTFYSVVAASSRIDHTLFHKDDHGKQLLKYVIGELDPIPGSHLFLDPLAPLFITGNQNRSRDVAASLVGLSRLIEERQINITGVCHFSKQKADKNDRYKRPQDRISGSGAFSGFSDTQMFLVDPELPKQPYYGFGWNPRNHKPEDFKLVRDQWFTLYVGPDMVGQTDEEVLLENLYNSPISRLHTMILQSGSTGLASPALLATAKTDLQISKATFYRLVTKLREDGKIEVSNTGFIKARA